jgi:tight adherence protein B
MPILLAGGMGLALVLIFVGADRYMRTDDPAFENRLRRYALRQGGGVEAVADQRGSAMTTAMSDRVGKAIAGRSFAANLQADLARADLKLTAAEFLVMQGIVTLVFIAVGYTLVAVIFGQNLLAIPIFGLIGFILPKMWVGRRQSGRLDAFNNQLADTIVLMGNSLRSGMSLLQAMDMVAREGNPPISEEFGRVTREIGLGLSPQDALLHLVRRIKSEDLDLMVTAINVQHEVGGNLARILNTIAETIRERVKLKGEINTITSQQRMSGYILALLPVFVGGFLFLASPQYMRPMFAGFPYLFLPIAGAISIFLGFLVMKQIVNVEV